MPSTTEKKRIVGDFLARCNDYADERIAHYRSQLDAAGPADASDTQKKLDQWTSYRSFNKYTINELNGTELDDWFKT